MLIELYGLMITVLCIVIVGGVFYNELDSRYKDEHLFHEGLKEYFFYDKCIKPLKCEDNKISKKGLYEIKIRRPSKSFKKKSEEVHNEILEELYGKLEKATKSSPNK